MKKVTLLLIMIVFFGQNIFLFAQEGRIPSLKFRDADIRVVLQAVIQKAVKDGGKVNIIISPQVKGPVTVDLENVDWQTALDAVLKTYDYGYEWVGKNIILVDTLDNLAKRRKKVQEAQIAEPLATRAFTLNFAKVEEIKDTLEKLLTPKGRLTYDKRTNTLVITDTQSKLYALEETIKALDEITPQVLIEAKILETDLDVTNKLGINWNIQGTVSGSKRAHTWPFTKHSENKYLRGDDIPGVSSVHTTLSDVFAFGTLDASSLSAVLEIIFSDTSTKILSTPKITTMDNHTATIDVITEDPVPNYTYNSETGSWEISGYEWVKYGVSLEVTPQINKEGFVTLNIKPKVSERLEDRTFTSAGATAYIPKLYTQTTSTKVMIKDGETLVIGGLVRDKVVDTVNKIPLLGDIPILGYFFKHRSKTTEKKNLLIFITPKIVTPQKETASAK
ncbi:MAG: secretin and TonB N-terminal domain-containing protein [Candidatus Omnitrophica bacterium]|nr:secretin and TonB N-terminal domain-containing protein [Candidatus Omnitrophota bacterium]